MRFGNESMLRISDALKEELNTSNQIRFEVLNPDCAHSTYAGAQVDLEGQKFIYRGYKAWIDLAELLFCRMLTPKPVDAIRVELCFERLNLDASFHKTQGLEEKYGIDSPFSHIHKNEEPAFLLPYKHALNNVKIGARKRVLDLGVNTGDEFELIKALVSSKVYETMEFIGIDHCASALEYARRRFPQANVNFIEHDINKLDDLGLGRFDLIISIGTFQSPNIDFKPFFMSLVQNYLNTDGAIILGFPNCRWMGGEMIYGAKVPNYPYSEMGMLYSDVMYCKKYLQQKKFRVTLTGKDYVFLTATRIGQGVSSK